MYVFAIPLNSVKKGLGVFRCKSSLRQINRPPGLSVHLTCAFSRLPRRSRCDERSGREAPSYGNGHGVTSLTGELDGLSLRRRWVQRNLEIARGRFLRRARRDAEMGVTALKNFYHRYHELFTVLSLFCPLSFSLPPAPAPALSPER